MLVCYWQFYAFWLCWFVRFKQDIFWYFPPQKHSSLIWMLNRSLKWCCSWRFILLYLFDWSNVKVFKKKGRSNVNWIKTKPSCFLVCVYHKIKPSFTLFAFRVKTRLFRRNKTRLHFFNANASTYHRQVDNGGQNANLMLKSRLCII